METVHYTYGQPPQYKDNDIIVYLYYSGAFTPPIFNIQQEYESVMIIPQIRLHIIKMSNIDDLYDVGRDYAMRINRDAEPSEYNCPPNVFFIVAKDDGTIEVVVTGDFFLREFDLNESEDEEEGEDKQFAGFYIKRFKYHRSRFHHIFHKFIVGVDQVNILELPVIDGFACNECPPYSNCASCTEC